MTRQPLDFFTTQLLPCPYLPGLQERKLVTELRGEHAASLYDLLARHGFRRSHGFAYRPYCPGCASCIPARVRVADFKPTRGMRRSLKANADLRAELRPPDPTEEQFEVFSRYVIERHSDGDMAEMTLEQYGTMLRESTVRTKLVEFRDDDQRLVAGLISDRLADGLSMVYSFFDPARAGGSPGTFMILWAIAKAQALGLPYIYLGYYVNGCRKMDYKTRFAPVDLLTDEGWREL